MTKTDKKIISIFLLLIMIIAQLSPVFAADYAGQETTKTLTQYLIENGVDGNGDGVLSDAEWAKVKNLDLTNIDLTGIEKAINLQYLNLMECDIQNVDFSKLVNLKTLILSNMTLTVNDEQNIGKASNLNRLELYRCDNYVKIEYDKLTKLESLYIYGCNDQTNLFKFPSIPSLEELIFGSYDNMNVDLSNIKDIEYLDLVLSNESTVKFPKFTNMRHISVRLAGYENGQVKVDGILDLSASSFINAYLSIDPSKLISNEKVLYSMNNGEIILSPIDEEINIMKDTKYHLITGNEVYELVQNGNDDIATFSKEENYSDNLLLTCEIVAKNVGTTNMKIKDKLGHEATIKINVYDKKVNNIDTTLENSGVTAKFLGDCSLILKSNGELWEVNSSTTAEKIDTNVKDYVADSVYVQAADDIFWVSNLLKNDGKLKIEYLNTTKEVINVKQIEDNMYLTNDGKLYELGLNYITEEINPKLIKENVKKLIGECIVLEDGTTWYQDYYKWHDTSNVKFKKLADFEIIDMGYYKWYDAEYDYNMVIPTVINNEGKLFGNVNKNTLAFNDSGLEILEENFEGYKLQPYGGFYQISGIKILENGDAITEYYYDYELGEYVNCGPVILSNVSQAYYNYFGGGNTNNGYILIRTDGTIWTYSDSDGLTKITKSTPWGGEEEEKPEFINPTAQINTKELGTSAMISGISNNTNVQNFIKQNNFNNAYQIKVFDKNNKEITGESLIGTGSTVRLYKDEKIVKEYVVVIYGDTTGDGKITAVDALAVIKHINNKIAFTKEAYSEAGRVRTTSGNTLTSVDALAIIKGVNGKFTINQNK